MTTYVYLVASTAVGFEESITTTAKLRETRIPLERKLEGNSTNMRTELNNSVGVKEEAEEIVGVGWELGVGDLDRCFVFQSTITSILVELFPPFSVLTVIMESFGLPLTKAATVGFDILSEWFIVTVTMVVFGGSSKVMLSRFRGKSTVAITTEAPKKRNRRRSTDRSFMLVAILTSRN